jgi:hypothetical protein
MAVSTKCATENHFAVNPDGVNYIPDERVLSLDVGEELDDYLFSPALTADPVLEHVGFGYFVCPLGGGNTYWTGMLSFEGPDYFQ